MSAAEKTKQDNSISKKLLSKELYYDFKFPDTVFRRVVKDDIPEIISLHDVLFPVKYSDSFFNSLIRRDDMHTILAFSVEDGVLTGVSTARIEEKSESCYAIREGYISTLGVKPGYRRHGLGKFLLEVAVYLISFLFHYNDSAILENGGIARETAKLFSHKTPRQGGQHSCDQFVL